MPLKPTTMCEQLKKLLHSWSPHLLPACSLKTKFNRADDRRQNFLSGRSLCQFAKLAQLRQIPSQALSEARRGGRLI